VAKVRDSQRSAVYKWETSLGTARGEQMSLDDCRELVVKVWRRYGYGREPKLKDGRGTRRAWGSAVAINLPRHSRNAQTVLHEVGHSLVQLHLGDGVAGHGPEFTRVLLGLMCEYLDVDGSKAHRKGVLQEPRKVRFSYRDYLKEFRQTAKQMRDVWPKAVPRY
jgi:hypothetical protein